MLPPRWKTDLLRTNLAGRGAVPGSRPHCELLSVVVGPASLMTERPNVVRALRGLDRAAEGLGTIYVGELDGAKVLVVHVVATSPAHAEQARKAVERTVSQPVTLDCRVPWVETMVVP
ncbi:hypothetical protein [Paraliomyxa miuraensis]|uniref:hypothetical protein n=1 Tax=Paraliomyxa miuraensis TaxID=376150 RepID=UPI00224EB765|nr:hypothetical protein [Paraliomyxa miuraensis]MCX4239919.1 hypothetical protein [Paraliomyxa miuraensis]